MEPENDDSGKHQVLLSTGHIHVDAGAFPVVHVTFTGAPPRDDFNRFLDACSALFSRRVPFVAVVDATDGGALPYEHILDAAAWLEREDGRRRAYCRGIALVLPGPVQRAVLRALLRLSTVGTHAVKDDVADAAEWARAVLARPSDDDG